MIPTKAPPERISVGFCLTCGDVGCALPPGHTYICSVCRPGERRMGRVRYQLARRRPREKRS